MKMALVCDDLTQHGGQERLVVSLLKELPFSDLYTSIMSTAWKSKLDSLGVSCHTSFLQRLPFKTLMTKIYGAFLLHVLAFESFDLSDYDVVLSVSSRFAHHIITKPTTRHVCYMNSPGRMFWEPSTYFKNKKLQVVLFPFLSWFRHIDYVASKRVGTFLANAKTPQERIRKYYKKESCVVYPFVDSLDKSSMVPAFESYFLVISRLVSWKKIDIVIKACEELGLSLKIVGEGPDKKRLRSLAGINTEFLGYVSENEKIRLLMGSRALIHSQKEDFGLTPLEAMSCGKPVIAYAAGGALETVVSETGAFFLEQTAESLKKVLKEFDPGKYDPQKCKSQVSKFSKEKFMNQIREQIGIKV